MQNFLAFVLFFFVSLFAVPAFAADGFCGADGCAVLRFGLGLVGLGLVGLAAWGVVCAIRGRSARICRETDARRRLLAGLEVDYRIALSRHRRTPSDENFARAVHARGAIVGELGPAILQAPGANPANLPALPEWPAPGGAAPAAPANP